MEISRRRFLELAATAGSAAALGCAPDDYWTEARDGWKRGDLQHLLPTASHRAFNIKLSFREAPSATPRLRVSGPSEQIVSGTRQDSGGRFFAFRVGRLSPSTQYRLRLESPTGDPLCEEWPLRTLPAPDEHPEVMRAVSFTCAGGANFPVPPSLFCPFQPSAYRQRLLDIAHSEGPDFIVANGDHVYWDIPMMARFTEHPLGRVFEPLLGTGQMHFDLEAPVVGTQNERALTAVGDDQIARTYGVRFRSTPVFFVTDDHDYFENDDATPERVTFPPSDWNRTLRDTLQRLYFPEFIVEEEFGAPVPGVVQDGGLSLSRNFGEVRFGSLFRGLLYDCGGYLSLGSEASLVPASVEEWLLRRTLREDTRHLVHFPSHPAGWTAGKWREWYPDYLASTGSVVATVGTDEDGGKYLWQRGWWEQHQRLLGALSSQKERAALILSGDLHALGASRILRSGSLDLEANPVHTVLSGPVGTGDLGWPSRARGVVSRIPEALESEALLELDERNGLTRIEVTPEAVDLVTFGCPPGYTEPTRIRTDDAVHLRLPRRA